MRFLLPLLFCLYFHLYHALPTTDSQFSTDNGDGLNGVPTLTDEKRAARDAIPRPADTDHLLARDDVIQSRWKSLPAYGEEHTEIDRLNHLLDQRWSPQSTPELLKATDHEVAQLFSLHPEQAPHLVFVRLGALDAKHVNIEAVSKDVNLMSDLSAWDNFRTGFSKPQKAELFNELSLINTPEKMHAFLSTPHRVGVVYVNPETDQVVMQKKMDRLYTLGEAAEAFHGDVPVDTYFSDPTLQQMHNAKVDRLALTRRQIFGSGIRDTAMAQTSMQGRLVAYHQVYDWYYYMEADMANMEHRYELVLNDVNEFFIHKAEVIEKKLKLKLPSFEDATKGLPDYTEAMTHEEVPSERGSSVPMSPVESVSGVSDTSSHSIAQKWQSGIASMKNTFRA